MTSVTVWFSSGRGLRGESEIRPVHFATQTGVIIGSRHHSHTDVVITVTTFAEVDQDEQLLQGMVVL